MRFLILGIGKSTERLLERLFVSTSIIAGCSQKKCVAFLLENAADDRASPIGATLHDFFRKNVDLSPAVILQETD